MAPADGSRSSTRFSGVIGFVVAIGLSGSCSLANEFGPVEQREPLACEADPCRALRPQCGCDETQMCVAIGGANACVSPIGTDLLAETCEGLSCAPGLSCLGFAGSTRLCLDLCESDEDCTELSLGAECIVPLANDDVLSACSLVCDLRGTAGCPSGMKCAAFITEGQWYRVCVDAGIKGQGELCDRQGDCGLGFFCVSSAMGADPACLAYCVKGANDCPLDHVCASFSTALFVDDVEFGVCVPGPS